MIARAESSLRLPAASRSGMTMWFDSWTETVFMARLLRKGSGVLLAFALSATGSMGQTPAASRGTKHKLENPLNDLLDEARREIDKQDFQAAVGWLQKFLAEKDDFAYAHFRQRSNRSLKILFVY